ncbi:hypothetical protein [Pectobacterium aquaticum]|uniref:hypothetical protein n=1 Tax=Pectobacterium aquaticum TaxID=2204145 RepID=UPI000E288B7C|nr:hypothetical protein [Pectobacterium aquaticum]UEM40625.1 hypothetical protein DMB82_0006485 [Pectobacterium aquaticum]
MSEFFDIETPNDLYTLLKNKTESFNKTPNDETLFFIIFILNHLREWIYSDGHESYIQLPVENWSQEQILHSKIYAKEEYKIINELCNRTKHFEKKRDVNIKKRSFTLGVTKLDDEVISGNNYHVDSKNIKDIINSLLSIYGEYFKRKDNVHKKQ